MCDTNTEDPLQSAPLPTPARRAPNQKGDEPRIRLAGGPHVDTATLAELHTWQGRADGISYGVAIDRLVTFAKRMGFDPVKQAFTGTTDLTAYPRFTAGITKRISGARPKAQRR